VQELDEAVAVVTGAGSGIGRSIALSLAAAGTDVVIADINVQAASGVAAEAEAMGVAAIAVPTDVTSRDAHVQLAESAFSRFDSVDVLVLNAGVTLRPFRALWDADPSDFEWIMNTNFWGVYNGLSVFVPLMLAQPGRKNIVVTSSMGSVTLVPGHAAYVASKCAVDGLTRTIRAELSDQGIAVTSIHPGAVTTSISASERLRPAHERSENRDVLPWSTYAGNPPASLPAHKTGIDPNTIGPMVVEAIRHDWPYVLTHPAPADDLRAYTDDLIDSYRP
jgi:NAD(P)-dependent dehydrogenase (short-subunit alcohol dehydrogenase family)